MNLPPAGFFFLPALVLALLAPSLQSASYEWDGGAGSMDWSASTNWNPDGLPGAGDTATLPDTANGRTVVYDSGSTGSVGVLLFEQATPGATNALSVQRNLTNTALVTLGAPAGAEQVTIGSSSAAGCTFVPIGGVVLDSGGELVMSATGNGAGGVNFGNTGGTATLTISGGTLTVAGTAGTTSAGSAANTLSMGLTMTSGALTIDNASGVADRRLLVERAVNVTGGDITTTRVGGGGALQMNTTNQIIFRPSAFDTDITLTLGASAGQSLVTDKTLFVVQARGTGTKTLASTADGLGIGQLQLFDANSSVPSSRTTVKLASDLALTPGAGLPAAQSFGNTHEAGRVDLGLDPAGFILDLSAGAGAGAWTPNASTQSGVTNTVWTLSGPGTLKAGSFNFSAANVTTEISADLVLEAVGGNSSANNLGGNGTLATTAATVFRYAGTAAGNAPATLTSSRNLGDLEVVSGALRLLSNSVGLVQDLRVAGGSLDLQGASRIFSTISLTGGTLANGTYQTGEAEFANLQTGTVSGSLVGAKKLVKNSDGTLTLGGNNNFSNNAVEVIRGTLEITAPGAVNGASALDVRGGTLDLGGNTVNKWFYLTNGGVIQNGTIERTSTTGWTFYDGTLAANVTATGTNVVNITKAGPGTLVLSGTNSARGNLYVSLGTMAISQTGAMSFRIGGAGTNNLIGGTTNGAALLDGLFVFDLSAASTNVGDSWTIVAAALDDSYGPNFLVSGFNGSGGLWTNTVGDVNYVYSQAAGTLTVRSSAPATNNYASWVSRWEAQSGGTFIDTAGADDPDGDGFVNDSEFAFDGNPTSGTPSLLTAVRTGTEAVFSFVVRKDPPGGASYRVQTTTDLAAGPWSDAGIVVTNSPDQTGITLPDEYERRQFVVPAGNRQFFRIEATLPP